MAGDWLKIEHGTPDKPEVLAIAARMKIAPDQAFGICFRMWRWFDQHTQNGNARGVTTALLNQVLGVTGFAEAALIEEWLLETESGLALPHFERHNGKTSKERALTAKRVAKCKGHGNGKGNARSVTEALPREEKRREDIGEVSPITPQRKRQRKPRATAADILKDLDIPETLGHDAGAKQAILDWLEHKDRIGNQYTSVKSFATELARWGPIGPDRFRCAVTYSIGKEWKGIYEETTNGNGRSGHDRGNRKSAADGWDIGPGQRYQGPDEPVRELAAENHGDTDDREAEPLAF